MERSHSCSNFEARVGPGAAMAISAGGAATAGCKELPQPKPHAGSSDNLPLSICASSADHFPPNKPLRKRKKLQRQQSVVVDVDDLECDCAYAADLEENADHDNENDQEQISLDALPHLPSHFAQQQSPAHVSMALQRHISISCNSSNSNSKRSGLRRCRCLRHEESFDSCSTAPELSPQAQRQHRFSSLLLRDSSASVQSDSSRYSSVDSLLESRKMDPEAILINLGFGPVGSEDMLSRIPKRFLKPSQVPGIDTEAFVQRLTLASSLADSSVLGYRGLTGNPDMPPSSIVAKIMQRFEVNHQRKKSMGSIDHPIR
ncbi:uncharacterized protein LOC111075223 [Drosophila obscura]|uniref:uncharacterized protein LOC111075223 n=1 Tax=Drosophila obscura TaxID=7282 RepID=UPI001BB1205A|nr:uncharacterized protein LOC111075223 [Drosophila obscura]